MRVRIEPFLPVNRSNRPVATTAANADPKTSYLKTTTSAMPLRGDLLVKNLRDFGELRNEMSSILNSSYNGEISQEEFTSRMTELTNKYVKEDTPPKEREAIIRTISAFAKQENNVVSLRHAQFDPSKRELAKEYHEALMQRLRVRPVYLPPVRLIPAAEWVLPQNVQQFVANQAPINEWVDKYASNNRLRKSAVQTPNLPWSTLETTYGRNGVETRINTERRGILVDRLA